MLYICTKFHKNVKEFQSYGADTISISKFIKGHNSVKNVKKLCFFLNIYCLTFLYFCTQFLGKHEKFIKGHYKK